VLLLLVLVYVVCVGCCGGIVGVDGVYGCVVDGDGGGVVDVVVVDGSTVVCVLLACVYRIVLLVSFAFVPLFTLAVSVVGVTLSVLCIIVRLLSYTLCVFGILGILLSVLLISLLLFVILLLVAFMVSMVIVSLTLLTV